MIRVNSYIYIYVYHKEKEGEELSAHVRAYSCEKIKNRYVSRDQTGVFSPEISSYNIGYQSLYTMYNKPQSYYAQAPRRELCVSQNPQPLELTDVTQNRTIVAYLLLRG